LDRRERRKILGQGAPWAARPAQVQDGVDDHPQPPLPRPASPLWRRQQRRDLRPFPGPHLACVGQLVAPILRAGDFSPHVVAPALSANNTESQLTEITQLISQSGSKETAEQSSRRTHRRPRPCVSSFAVGGDAADELAEILGFTEIAIDRS